MEFLSRKQKPCFMMSRHCLSTMNFIQKAKTVFVFLVAVTEEMFFL